MNYIDFGNAQELITALSYLYDPDTTREPGNILRYILLEQVDSERCKLTSYLIGGAWYSRYITGFGVVGTKFLLDGDDLKSRLSNDVWKRHGLRLKGTNRNVISVQCMTDTANPPNLESNTYSGDIETFEEPTYDWVKLSALTDGWAFRKACNYINTFSKCKGDTSDRAVWLKDETYDSLSLYCTEFTGKSGISYIKGMVPRLHPEDVEINLGISARHLPRVSSVFKDDPTVVILVNDLEQPTQIRFQGDLGGITLPVMESYIYPAVSKVAPVILASPPLENEATRVFDLKQLYEAIIIQTPKKKANSEDLLLKDMDNTRLLITKQADILGRERSFSTYAAPDGLDDPWQPIVVNYQYLKQALSTMLKHSKDSEAQSIYESDDYEDDLEDEWALPSKDAPKSLVTLTQAYSTLDRRWCLFIDPVPYSQQCRTFVAAKIPKDVSDRLTGE
jgi:hypothetical protein